MKFDILSFAMGMKAGKASGGTGGGSSETVIFAEQTLGFEYSEGFGAYYAGFNTSPFSLVDGQEYIVVWDGKENKRTAFAFTNSKDGSSCVALGNPLVTGGAANEDKFAVVEDKTNDNAYFFSLETTSSHTVKIYQKASGGNTGGGGSLPAGVYYEPMPLRAASSYDELWVMLNNERYAITSKYNNNANMTNAYKMDDVNNTKTQVISEGTTNLTSTTMLSLEFNGKLHFWENRESYRHVTFDGSAFAICTDIGTGSNYHNWLFIQDNKLKAYEGGKGKVFVWNEENDTWTEEATVFSSRTMACFVNLNGTVYVVSGGKIYTYDGATVTQIGSIAKSAAHRMYFGKDDCLYWYDSSLDVHKYDLETNIETVVGKVPLTYGSSKVGIFWEYDGKLCFQYHHYQYTTTMSYYVHIIE